ncbi:Ltp family lipoprotein [Geodermatophilus obscurus]|uniref:Ltp family lipoprotein n=1 Tax=Geodermatophilus obscurus TaxID=1861 RepID=UPI00019B7D90|nr:Ltp family lipoprotein [Geodermatophilus obscurus]
MDKAEQYLDVVGGFSRDGLIQQLTTGSGFSTEDATWAVDHLDVDWNEQAAEKARQYQDVIGGFSRSSMIQQLTAGSGFTQAQAEYGADAVGL